VRRLVLCATAPGLGGVPPKPLAALMLATPARYYHPKLAEWSLPFIAGGQVGAAHVRDRMAAPPSVLGYAFQLVAGIGWTSLPWLHTLPHETLVMGGDDDPAVPFANARILAARIPNARLERVRGGGHLFLLDEPERAAAPIRAFLDM
jgi:pimeloyl-ACP methyl ester carboxylesterase